jgi:hypothetical protein
LIFETSVNLGNFDKWSNRYNRKHLTFRYDYYEKAVTFKPYQVDMLDPVTANFLGDNLRCWMQIQVTQVPPDFLLTRANPTIVSCSARVEKIHNTVRSPEGHS